MSDIHSIKQALNSRAQVVASMLLPAGKKEGAEWRVGSTDGEKGKSLGVHLYGSKAGVWFDFSKDIGGDLIDLWMLTRKVGLVEALDQAREFCGITKPVAAFGDRKSYTRPPKPKCTKPTERVMDYLTEDRNIPASTVAAYKIAADGEMIVFPYLDPAGDLILAKTRKAENGASPKPTAANCEPILFGWQAVPENAREIIITEGEIDALSWHSYGHPALSVPFGGGKGAKQQWIENEYDRLAQFDKIYISTDMDEVGEQAAGEIINRLGRHRCYRVNLPLKDANACRQDGRTKTEMDALLSEAQSYDPDGLKRASAFTDEVIGLFWPKPNEHIGYRTPYGKLGDQLMFRPGEVTIWTGPSGSGKSQVLSDCCPDWIKQGSRICIASLEMKPAQTLKRMVKQTSGIDRPTEQFIGPVIDWLSDGLLMYERVGKAGVDGLLEVFDYARAKYGCDQFIIDSLMRMGIASDDYNGQEKAVFRIVDWAIKSNVHVHLVAHSRKGERGGGVAETEDIKGASEIGSNAFNIIAIWRDRTIEDKLKNANTDEEIAELQDKPGVHLNVAKQRNGDFEGRIGLWFDQDCYQYNSSHDRGLWKRQYVKGSFKVIKGEVE